MKAYRSLKVFLLLLLITEVITAQNTLPQVIPTTPHANSLFKYIDYPVDYSTGLPQINIPLYEIKSGELSVPISISYHSSGRRVYDETGAIGLGWTLMAGGMISRTVYGDADDNDYSTKFPVPWKSQIDINEQNDIDFLARIDNDNTQLNSWFDTEYDIFSYSVNSISGKFVLKDINNTKTAVFIPKKPYLLQWHTANTQFTINYFDELTLTDDKGIIYKFSAREQSSPVGAATAPTTAWLLTSMTSPDHLHVITFKYQSSLTKQRRRISQNTVVYDQYHNYANESDPQNYEAHQEIQENYNDENFNTVSLTEIDFDQGKVIFNLESGTDRIVNIQVFDLSNRLIKQVDFNRSNLDQLSDGNELNRKLDNIIIKGSTATPFEQYSFAYYPTVYPSGNNYVNARFCDYWGYYNASGQIDMRPYTTISVQPANGQGGTIPVGNANAVRTPDLAATKSGVLQKITFPTGGTTEFVYELNKYQDPQTSQIKNCGGLRVYQIKTTDLNGTGQYRTYHYGSGESGYGNLPLIPDPIKNMSSQTSHYDYEVTSGSLVILKYILRIFSADVLPIFNYISQKPVTYTEVTEYLGTESDNIGKTVLKYDYDDNIAPTSLGNGYTASSYKYWKNSSLTEKTDYKSSGAIGSKTYTPVKFVKNYYNEIEYANETVNGLRVKRDLTTSPSSVLDADGYSNGCTGQYIPSYKFAALRSNVTGPFNGPVGFPLGSFPVFAYADYALSVGKKELTRTDETIYTDAGQLLVVTTYEYNSNHLLKKTNFTNSKGETITKEFKYPFDFTSDPSLGTISTKMVNANMLDYPIEQIDQKNSNALKSVETVYKDWSSTSTPQIAPQIIQTKQGSSSYEPRIRYYSYDAQTNPTAVSKENDIQKVYIWGYNKSYPVAEIIGADYATASSYVTQSLLDNPTDDATLRAHLNNLRNIPNAQVTTYTYRPLVGMTSATDVNGRTNYYIYDAFGRLAFIRDKDNNVIKKFCYNYLGEPGNCSIYGNAVKYGTYTKNDCPSGTSGTQVTYTVPANTYYSSTQTDADAIAQNDVNTNGQAYANANGTCNAPQITVNGHNYTTAMFYVSFTNTSTNQVYYLYMYPNSNCSTQMPAGTYNVYFYQYGSLYTYFNINGYSTYGTSVTFNNVSIGNGSYAQVGY